jgi:hypothetical protein
MLGTYEDFLHNSAWRRSLGAAVRVGRDGLIVDESHADTGWNGIWTSAARITPRGWRATIGIPFSR